MAVLEKDELLSRRRLKVFLLKPVACRLKP
jgi:hypothetical protein